MNISWFVPAALAFTGLPSVMLLCHQLHYNIYLHVGVNTKVGNTLGNRKLPGHLVATQLLLKAETSNLVQSVADILLLTISLYSCTAQTLLFPRSGRIAASRVE